jgi:hypothetical protein
VSGARLPAVAVIPDELYVERAADRQLAAAILGMGRPPYVLDPRQMGKTNLLLHARRRLESDDLRFVYVDLSVRVASDADFYRRVLHLASTSHPDLFTGSAVEAFGQAAAGMDPSAAFQALIVERLDAWPGRLAIVLDEVDGLTGLPFSDSVFAFIRSIFFTRETVLALKRLTFVLAGVAEPSQLIRDKSISPFNIGQKIFLRDFSAEQVGELVGRAALPFGPEVVDRIIYWTSGNPRLTWDIASELDQMDEAGEALSVGAVDDAVERLFLVSYDRPPIDHIRTLVEHDPALRNAVAALRRSSDLTDAQRTALYLAGIATRAPSDVQPAFRSRIVDRAMTERWLAELEQSAAHLLGDAQVAFQKRRFSAAISGYRDYFAGRTLTATDRVDVIRLGVAQLEEGLAAEALMSFELAGTLGGDPMDPSFLAWTGRAKRLLGRLQEAEQDFRAILASANRGRHRVAALVGIARIAAAEPDRVVEARSLALEAVATLEEPSMGSGDEPSLRDQRNALELAASLTEGQERVALLRRAIELQGAPPSLRALAMLADASAEQSRAELDRIVDTFVTAAADDLAPAQLGPAGAVIRRGLGPEAFNGAVEALAHSAGLSRDGVLAAVFDGLVGANATDDALLIGREAMDRVSDAELARHIGRTLILRQSDFDAGLAGSYLDSVARNGGALVRNDYLALVSVGAGASRGGDGGRLNARLLATSQRLSKPTDPLLRQSFLLVRYVQILAATRSGDYEAARSLSADARLLVDEIRAAPEPDLPASVVDGVVDFLDRLPSVHSPQTPVRNQFRTIGRNEVVTVEYRDGSRVTAKFKALRQDVSQGACVVVEREDQSA